MLLRDLSVTGMLLKLNTRNKLPQVKLNNPANVTKAKAKTEQSRHHIPFASLSSSSQHPLPQRTRRKKVGPAVCPGAQQIWAVKQQELANSPSAES